jgi:hypothetical protein
MTFHVLNHFSRRASAEFLTMICKVSNPMGASCNRSGFNP